MEKTRKRLTQKAQKYTEKNKFSHRKHGNTQKFFCTEKDVVFFHGDTQKIFCAVEDDVFFHGKEKN